MKMHTGLDAAVAAVCKTATANADTVDRANAAPEETLAALRRESLLSLLVPTSLGGQGQSLTQLAATCHALAQACGSSAMIFAMHHIQVACIVAHGQHSDWHRALLRRLCTQQLLLGSVTSEAGTGGNIHASICAVEPDGAQVRLQKDATTISYGAQSDALLITARRARCSRLRSGHAGQLRGDYRLGTDRRLGCTGHARHLQRRLSFLPDGVPRADPAGASPRSPAEPCCRFRICYGAAWLHCRRRGGTRAPIALTGAAAAPRCRRAVIDWRGQRR